MEAIYSEEQQLLDLEASAQAEGVAFHFHPSRREFVQTLGAGILIAVTVRAWGQAQEGAAPARGSGAAARGAQGRGGGGIGGTPPANLFARLHIGKDGIITVLCGKVECGQGARA